MVQQACADQCWMHWHRTLGGSGFDTLSARRVTLHDEARDAIDVGDVISRLLTDFILPQPAEQRDERHIESRWRGGLETCRAWIPERLKRFACKNALKLACRERATLVSHGHRVCDAQADTRVSASKFLFHQPVHHARPARHVTIAVCSSHWLHAVAHRHRSDGGWRHVRPFLPVVRWKVTQSVQNSSAVLPTDISD